MKSILLSVLVTIGLFAKIVQSQTNEPGKVKADILFLLTNHFSFFDFNGITPPKRLGSPSNILILDDRIEMTFKKNARTVYYTDKLDHPTGSQFVTLGTIEFIDFKNDFAGKLAENLIYMRNQFMENKFNSELVLFEPIAAQYRALQEKPSITEEQRKFIVQANGFNEQKMYEKAIELYKKAIEIDQTAYPAAYSNLALLSAQINQFNAAICYMKKYLMLVPEAEDARSAQDKIYVWEAQINQ